MESVVWAFLILRGGPPNCSDARILCIYTLVIRRGPSAGASPDRRARSRLGSPGSARRRRGSSPGARRPTASPGGSPGTRPRLRGGALLGCSWNRTDTGIGIEINLDIDRDIDRDIERYR